MINRILIGLILVAVGFTAGVLITWQDTPMEQLYKDYNHIRIHEDGSYEAETRDGIRESGCILKAQCND